MRPLVAQWIGRVIEQIELWREDGRIDPLILHSGKKHLTLERLEVLNTAVILQEESAEMVKTQRYGRDRLEYFIVIRLKNPEEFMDMLIDDMGPEQAERTLKQAYEILKENEHDGK